MKDLIGLPKSIIDSAEKFFGKLLGDSLSETGLLLSDKIKYLRFKNQVKILNKAETLLMEKGISPKAINLKILVPLIEYSSLESSSSLQEKWAKLIANSATKIEDESLVRTSIEILNQISPIEAKILDSYYDILKFTLENSEKEQVQSLILDDSNFERIESLHFEIRTDIKEQFALDLTLEKRRVYIERLISLGLMKYAQPRISSKVDSIHIHRVNSVHFTYLGIYFVELCK